MSLKRRAFNEDPSVRTSVVCAGAVAITLWLAPTLAAESNMPWEQSLQRVLEFVQCPVLQIIAVLIIIVTGLTLMFGDTSGRFRRLIQIVFGLSIAFKVRSRACMLRSQIHAESANTDGYVNTFIERTYRVLQVIESIVPAEPCLRLQQGSSTGLATDDSRRVD
jgi:type IV secretion system protein TrbC